MRQFTAEHREKLSQAKLKKPVKYWLNKKRPDMVGHKWNLGRPAWNKGKPWSDEVKKKFSESRRGKRQSIKTEFKKGQEPINKKGWKLCKMKSAEGIKIYKQILVNFHPFGAKAKCNRKYVFEHRLVMEQSLGRYLKPGEVVHHINHDTLDNKIDNLALFSSPGTHLRDGHKFKLPSSRF